MGASLSQPTPLAQSPWDAALAADKKNRDAPWGAEDNPEWGGVSRNGFAHAFSMMAKESGDWAGMPIPLVGERLTIEPSYAYADKQDELNRIMCPEKYLPQHMEQIPAGVTVRNQFWSTRLMSTVMILEENGKFDWGRMPGVNHLNQDMTTLGCADAWSLETEFRAMDTLRGLLTHRQFRQYLLTGTFIESSKKSGVFYMFRRLRPTVAMSGASGVVKVLCALCLHPVAYYQESWAGAQCPSDDVMAHLMLMRGDEALYWRRANQHPAIRPEAGL